MSFQCSVCANKNTVDCMLCQQCEKFKPKKQTKADRLRSMTDDELAKALTEISDKCPDGFNCDEVIFTDCCDCWLSWIQSNADDN